MNPTSKAAVLGQAGLTAMAARVSAANLRGFGADGGFGQPANNSGKQIQNELCLLPRPGWRWKRSGKELTCRGFSLGAIQQQSGAQLANVIAEARGNLPAFGTRLSEDQIDTLVRYIRTLVKAK